MKPYDENSPCPKCGGRDVWTVYHRATVGDAGGGYDCRLQQPCHWKVREEHLSRGCRRCSFEWTEGMAAPREAQMSCLVCGQVKERAVWDEPSGVFACFDCRAASQNAAMRT